MVGPRPYMKHRRLRACGVRPINNIVDITNYVLFEYAQPLHAFDLARLSGPAIHVLRAREKEKLLSLDGVVRDLTPDMLVIADALRPVAIAGVIGGEETAVTTATTDILLESANFSGPSVRQTSRALGLRTEASARFERALPPELALAGARRAASLISELAGGTVHREWADIYPRPQQPVRVNLRPALIDDVLGTHVPLEEAESILKRLNFHVKVMGDGEWDVLPPVFRLDVTIPEDLVEEVGRVYGYDRVPATLPGRGRLRGGNGGRGPRCRVSTQGRARRLHSRDDGAALHLRQGVDRAVSSRPVRRGHAGRPAVRLHRRAAPDGGRRGRDRRKGGRVRDRCRAGRCRIARTAGPASAALPRRAARPCGDSGGHGRGRGAARRHQGAGRRPVGACPRV